MDEEKLFLHHAYDGVESGPAEVLERTASEARLRLLFIPFGFATPTFGDVVRARRDGEFEGHWAFEVPEATGMDVADLEEHGGYYAMIVDFVLADGDEERWFPDREDIYSSLAWGAEPDRDGRVYLAVPSAIEPKTVLAMLEHAHPNGRFTRIHP